MMGAPGSGKSYHARRWVARPEWEVVSSDWLRGLVSNDDNNQRASKQAFALLHQIVAYRLKNGQGTLADTTALTPQARAKLGEIARENGREAHLLMIHCTLEEALENQRSRGYRPLPYPANLSMHKRLEESLRDAPTEGFSSFLVLDRESASRFQRVRFGEAR